MNRSLAITFLALAALALSFVVTDCSLGITKHVECSVWRHRYVPPWVEVHTNTDSEGHSYTTTTYHNEEWRLDCLDVDANTYDVEVRAADYHAITNDQPVTVKVRVGKWTKGRYLPRLVE